MSEVELGFSKQMGPMMTMGAKDSNGQQQSQSKALNPGKPINGENGEADHIKFGQGLKVSSIGLPAFPVFLERNDTAGLEGVKSILGQQAMVVEAEDGPEVMMGLAIDTDGDQKADFVLIHRNKDQQQQQKKR